jgi:NAD(P)H dehydrogenase (quinone)
MLLITGATGELGTATIHYLTKKAPIQKIAALIRNEAKAVDLKEKGMDTRQGDYNDRDSLANAFKGVDKLFFISGNDVVNRLKQHENVVEAAKSAGVKHIIYTSFDRKTETPDTPLGVIAIGHIETDKMIRASGIPYTIMRNGLYADVLPGFIGKNVFETGIYFPAGDGRVAFITRDEIAEVAANILTSTGHLGKEYAVSNITSYSLEDAAKMLSLLSGKKVKYSSPTVEAYKTTLSSADVSSPIIDMLATFGDGIRLGEFEKTSPDIEKLLGRKPAPLNDFFKETYFKKPVLEPTI